MTFHCWVFRGWVFEAYYREYPTRNLDLGIPDVGHSRRWVFQMLGIPYENRFILVPGIIEPERSIRVPPYKDCNQKFDTTK